MNRHLNTHIAYFHLTHAHSILVTFQAKRLSQKKNCYLFNCSTYNNNILTLYSSTKYLGWWNVYDVIKKKKSILVCTKRKGDGKSFWCLMFRQWILSPSFCCSSFWLLSLLSPALTPSPHSNPPGRSSGNGW